RCKTSIIHRRKEPSMGSVVRRMRRRKRCLGEVRVLRREDYQGLELNARVELIQSLIPLGLMHVQMLLEEEVEGLAGARYAREDGATGGFRERSVCRARRCRGRSSRRARRSSRSFRSATCRERVTWRCFWTARVSRTRRW